MRLIDADALIEEMNTSQKQPTSDENIEGYCEGWNDLADIINQQPTAYNVDSVVEYIQDVKKNFEDVPVGYSKGATDAFNVAIATIRKGGVNE